MSTKLTVLLSGVVGVDPRLLFLTTPASEAEVLQPGFMNTIEDVSGIDISPGDFIFTLYENGTKRELFIADFGPSRVITLQGIAGEGAAPGGVTGGVNLGSGQGIYAGVDGSDLEFKSLKAGTNVTLSGSGTEITINATGGSGGSNFDYQDTWFMGINGNDANDGKSINTPKATLQGCQAAFTSTRNVINVIDAGPYQDIEFFHESGDLIINAPGAKFETTQPGFPLFWIQGGNLHLKVHEIQNSFSLSAAVLVNNGLLTINSYKIGASGGSNAIFADGGAVYVDTHYLGASVQIGTTAYITTRFLVGDLITDDGTNPGDLYVHANFESATISGSGTVTGIIGGTLYNVS